MDQKNPYDLKGINLPRLSGTLLRLSTTLMETPATRGLIMPNLLNKAGLDHLRRIHLDDLPTFTPVHLPEPAAETASQGMAPDLDEWLFKKEEHSTHFSTIQDYATAYRNGEHTPEQVAQCVLSAIAESEGQDPPLRAFIACHEEDVLNQSRESTQRYEAGKPLSILDGVPIAIKDEVDQLPYPTTVGTRFLAHEPASKDATAVARLRAAGALLIGKTNMHELGLGTTGLNPHHGTVRNPYDPERHSGGSSSGSAAAVAAGLCPAALAADGGGSIRTPAAFCGLIGLKPTFGRISECGAFPVTTSMGHLGPIAATTVDAALIYYIMAGLDPADVLTSYQPPVSLPNLERDQLNNLTIGVYQPWFQHAASEVVRVCQKMLDQFEEAGIKIKDVFIPELEAMRLAHLVIIASEVAAVMQSFYQLHRNDLTLENRANLAMAYTLTAQDYLKSQRIRTRAIQHFKHALSGVDVIVTPVSAIPAPPIRNDALTSSEANMHALAEMLRFTTPANLTGLPAISFPAGYDSNGMPVGMQAIAAPWQENTLLQLAHLSESLVQRQKPRIYFDVLRRGNQN